MGWSGLSEFWEKKTLHLSAKDQATDVGTFPNVIALML